LRRSEKRRGQFDVVLAPRGAAKSTLVSLIFPVHALLYQEDRYILIVSSTRHQAQTRLAAIRRALLDSPRIQEDFPHAVNSWKQQIGRCDPAQRRAYRRLLVGFGAARPRARTLAADLDHPG
jgi:phage terminase large subunit-like protein